MNNFINLFFDFFRRIEITFDKKVFHRRKTVEKSYPHLLSNVFELHGNVHHHGCERVRFEFFIAAVFVFLQLFDDPE